MRTGFRCPECGAPNRLFDAMNGSVLAITRELRLEDALQRIVDAARELIGARFAAVGVAGDDDDAFSAWVTSGDAAGGGIPAATGVLASVIRERTAWAGSDPGGEMGPEAWPPELPAIGSLLAVPILADDRAVGAFYLGNPDRWGFSPEDRRMIELIAPHAAVAIGNARLHERSRELTVMQERNRLARELHDSVTQALFSMRLSADTAMALMDHGQDPDAAREQLEQVRTLSRTALAEMRALISELRPPDVEAAGIVETLRRHVEVLRKVHGMDVRVDATLHDRLDARREGELFRLAQEALANAVRHSGAESVEVRLENGDGHVRLTVRDDGRGFEPGTVAGLDGSFGLTSMRERAEALGARFSIASTPAQGTVVSVEVPR